LPGKPQIERKLAAIMFTDIAGYTESMSKSESKTLNLLEKKRSILKPLLKKYKGTFVKEIGDGTLSYFESAVNAATCAVKLQETTYDDKDMNIRVGIHIGDIVFKDGDVFGGGVNVASRLESIAPVGGVCVSKSVYDELSNQDDFDGIELGLQSLKGVGRLIEVYGLKGDKLNEPNPKEYQENKVAVHSDDEVPSIAIIPFKNKGKEEDAFYAYGISADLISDVSSAGLIRVASKKQIDDAGDPPQDKLAKILDVRYMANGELWRMGDMFQLSIELYDTQDKKVVWADRWQEKWDNLLSIKGSLSDGFLKALDTTSKVERKLETTNTEAYEFYLKGRYRYAKRKNLDDIEVAQGLLRRAIEIDDGLIIGKVFLGWSYLGAGNYDKAMDIYTLALKQAEELDDKKGMGSCLHSIGTVYSNTGNLDKALDYYNRSLKLAEEFDYKHRLGTNYNSIGIVYYRKGDYDKGLDYFNRSLKLDETLGNKYGMGYSLNNIGGTYADKGDYNKALYNYTRSLKIRKELSDKRGIGRCFHLIGDVYWNKGDFDKALDYFIHSLNIHKAIGDKRGMIFPLFNIGYVYMGKGDFGKAVEHLEKSLVIQKEIKMKEGTEWFDTITLLYLSYKNLQKKYDEQEILNLISETENIKFQINYSLYELLEDTSYLETAYNQVQEKASEMEEELGKKFLSYPIPKAIVEEWEKVK